MVEDGERFVGDEEHGSLPQAHQQVEHVRPASPNERVPSLFPNFFFDLTDRKPTDEPRQQGARTPAEETSATYIT